MYEGMMAIISKDADTPHFSFCIILSSVFHGSYHIQVIAWLFDIITDLIF